MLSEWAFFGRDVDQFWTLTLREVMLVLNAENRRLEYMHEVAFYTAWHSGLFSQSYKPGKFPDYDKNRPGNRSPKSQTWQEQKSIALALNAAFGGEVK